ncbi:MAG TPA: hypothetical protein VKB14_03320 [Actinomycetales bacterium]|nr:hypothetical protein [Actinomycetales bacterium]
MSDLAHLEHFFVQQRLTMMVNRYEIRAAAPDGSEGPVVALAQQKRMAFREHVTFYADEDRRNPVFSFRARQRIDLGATYDVLDAEGQPIGWFRKRFGTSLLRSTWELSAADGSAVTGTERSGGVAIARRLWDVLPIIENFPSPFLFHFDFTDSSGQVVMSSERKATLRDRYVVQVPGHRVDGRVAAAMAVALDALQSR